MFFFGRKNKARQNRSKEAEIKSIHDETFKQIDEKVDRLEVTNQKMAELLGEDAGVTGKIFLATGGDKRIVKRKGEN